MNDVVGRAMAPKDVHILTLRTCQYVMWQEGIKFADEIKAAIQPT